MICQRCESELPKGRYKCGSCLYWNVNAVDPLSDEGRQAEGDTVVTSFENVESAEHSRIHIPEIDYVFGGGVVSTSVNLIGGKPGAGKSTLIVKVASSIAAVTNKPVLYIAAEESKKEIRSRIDRLKITNLKPLLHVNAMMGVPNLGSILQRYKPGGVILDSIQALAGEENLEGHITVCRVLKTFADMYECPSMVISQVTKDGDYAGLNKLQHAVDGLFMVEEEEGLEDVRSVEARKNRFGKAYIRSYFLMTGNGMIPVNNDQLEAIEIAVEKGKDAESALEEKPKKKARKKAEKAA